MRSADGVTMVSLSISESAYPEELQSKKGKALR